MSNLGISSAEFFTYFIRAMVLLTAMPVHECSHGLVADRLGDDTPRNQGRLTLNPFAHLDVTGTILLLFTGFGWAKPVMVDMRNFKRPKRDMAFVSLAGPVSNLIISLIVLSVYRILCVFVPAFYSGAHVATLEMIFIQLTFVNIGLAVFNLLPVPPLDGSKIIGGILPDNIYWNMLRYQRQIAMIVMLLLLFTRILTGPIGWLARQIFRGLVFVTNPIDLLYNLY